MVKLAFSVDHLITCHHLASFHRRSASGAGSGGRDVRPLLRPPTPPGKPGTARVNRCAVVRDDILSEPLAADQLDVVMRDEQARSCSIRGFWGRDFNCIPVDLLCLIWERSY